ncbi:MAG: pentapeptide repeat-containing protein, partial [Pseudomonadota bacterium]
MASETPENAPTPMTQAELDAIIKKHVRFGQGRAGGGRAVIKFKSLVGLSLRQADLSGADFTGSDL